MLIALFLLYRIAYPKQTEKKKDDKPPLPPPPYDYETVVKSRFVLPDRSNTATLPAQHEDSGKNSEKQDKKPDIFAAGNDNPPDGVVQSDEFDEVFGENVNPEDLDIEPDENETDENDNSDLDADEEAEEIRGIMGEIEGYADGFTLDELTTVVHEADTEPDKMTKASLEKLRSLSGTDMFEGLVSSKKGRAARIEAILNRSDKILAEESENAADENDSDYRNYDVEQFFS